MASACTKSAPSSPSSGRNYNSSDPHMEKCSVTSTSSASLVDVGNSQSRNRKNHSKTPRGVPRSPKKRHFSTILMPPPGTYPRIPPFPGVNAVNAPATTVSNIYFPAIPPVPMPEPPPLPPPPSQINYPPEELMITTQFEVYPPYPCMIYQPCSESNGYRLMISMPVGHREDGTYGILTCGVRPDQEYRVSCYYVNGVTYYNLPEDISFGDIPTPDLI